MSIPVRNIYHLLTYAWNQLEEAEQISVAAEEADLSLLQLLARVLQRGITHVLKRGLARDYLPHIEVTGRLRGKLLLSESIQQQTFSKGQAACATDELSPDILANQLIMATLHRLLTKDELPAGLHAPIRQLYLRFSEVSLIAITDPGIFDRVRLHRNTAHYAFLLSICRFIYEQALATQATGDRLFQDFQRDEGKMARLFESFVRGFYQHHLRHRKVGSRRLKWRLEAQEEAGQSLLPTMLTDIVIEGGRSRLLIDCKYYREALARSYDQQRLISPHLYQLYAYLQHLQAEEPDSPIEGILLYPVVKQSLRHSYTLLGTIQKLHIATINLDQPWLAVEQDLLSLITDYED